MSASSGPSRPSADRWSRQDWIVLLALVLLATGLRFHGLGVVPPGFQFDEAYNASDAANVLAGDRPLFLPRNGGREVLYTYLQAAVASVVGLSLRNLRMVSALAGIAAVAASYVLLRGLLRNGPQQSGRRVAAFTSLALAISFWHLHFSHYGIRVILMPVIFSGVCGFFWLGWHKGSLWAFALSGALAGLSVWANPTGRLIPLVLIGYSVWQLLVAGRRVAVKRLPGLLLTALTAFLLFLPLGLEFLRHPDFFLGHASEVSIFADRVGAGAPLLALLQHGLAVLGMFSIEGDHAWIHNLSGRPVFDPLLSIPFWMGVVIWIRRLIRRDDEDRDALALLAMWAILMLMPSVFSDDPPNFSRTLPALPALFVAVGLGLAWIADGVSNLLRQKRLAALPEAIRNRHLVAGYGVVALMLFASGGLAFYDYFVRFANAPEAYYAYDADKLDAWDQLQDMAETGQVYLSKLWADHATVEFLRPGSSIKPLDTSNTVVMPASGVDAVYALPPEQGQRAASLASLWPDASRQQILDRYGKPLMEIVRVDADSLSQLPPMLAPQRQVEVAFTGGPTLLGMREGDGQITLFWRADSPMPQSLTTLLHLIDSGGRRVGQADRIPGDTSYPTTSWTGGERVIERFFIEAEPCLDDQPVRVLVGWYDLAAGGARLPRSDSGGDTALAGEVHIPLTSRPLAEMRPAKILKEALSDDLTLLGFETDGQDLQAGAPLALDLYWTGDPAAADRPLEISLHNEGSGAAASLWQGTVLPADARWQQDEAICRRLRLRLPAGAAGGSYSLAATVAGQHISLGDLTLGSSTRRFEAPPVDNTVLVLLGEQIRLVGASSDIPVAPGAPLTVTLVWQAAVTPQGAYTVFVHLVDDAGNIVAQSDGPPAAGYATDRWLPGEVVVDSHTLRPQTAGRYRLLAGMYDPVSGQRLAAQDEAGRPVPEQAIPLGEVNVP